MSFKNLGKKIGICATIICKLKKNITFSIYNRWLNEILYTFLRNVLPKIQESVVEVNDALREVCTYDELHYISYPLSKPNIGVDGLHVKPASA